MPRVNMAIDNFLVNADLCILALFVQMCFKDALFPLPARMRHGLYYNTHLSPGCLMQAFSKHLLARLGIHQEPSEPERVRVTLLSRSTKHRRITNDLLRGR